MSTTYLRVKIKSLSSEAKDIRLEERKRKAHNRRIFVKTGINPNECTLYQDETGSFKSRYDPVFWGLRHHRTHDVRRESRASLLAYAFLRGRAYRVVEKEGSSLLDPAMQERIGALIVKFGDCKEPGFKVAVASEIKAWLECQPLEAAKAA